MLCDHLGSVRDVLKTSGVVKHLEYDAFGKLINKSGAISVPFFRYTGKFTDDTTELQWNINRWYDANVGRWVSEDPIGFDANDVNLYRYVGNNTTLLIDLFGLLAKHKLEFIAVLDKKINEILYEIVNLKDPPVTQLVPWQYPKIFNIDSFFKKLVLHLKRDTTVRYDKTAFVSTSAIATYDPYWNVLTYALPLDGTIAIHESVHIYNDINSLRLSAEMDEAMGYIVGWLASPLFNGAFKKLERNLQKLTPNGLEDDEALPGDISRTTQKILEGNWNSIWSNIVKVNAVTIAWKTLFGAYERDSKESDFNELKKNYKIVISCSDYLKWVNLMISSQLEDYPNDCFELKCPDALPAIFK
jgi:RHS repeat-associated protein